MARTRPDDAVTQKAIFGKRLEQRPNPYPEGHKPSLDDLVFLAANLSRLVIDPYRDACNMASTIGESFKLELPFLAAGFDEVSSELQSALGQALAKVGSGYVGRVRLPGDAPWLQLVILGRDQPDPAAAGHIHLLPDGFKPFPVRHVDGKLVGLAARASELEAAIPFALDKRFDLLLLDATPGIARPWSELAASPDFTVMRDAIRILRRLNREEDLELLFFGGVRSGTDGAKLVSLGANAAVIGVSMALALGGEMIGQDIRFYGDRSEADRIDAAASILQALSAEASIMARCTGKTDVHNLEPEDLRSITIPTAEATGIPLAGARKGPAAAVTAE
jgi:hypothetical protein